MRKTIHSDGSTTVSKGVVDTLVTAEAGDEIKVVLRGKDGKPVPYIPVEVFDEGIARSYRGFRGILEDLTDSRKAFVKSISLFKDGDQVILLSLLVNAVVSYGRCFTSAEGRGGVTLNASHPWIDKNSNEIRWHKTLMDLRHKLFAHAGESPFRTSFALVIVDSKEQPKVVHGIHTGKIELAAFSPDDTRSCLNYLDILINRVTEKSDQLSSRLEQIAKDRIR